MLNSLISIFITPLNKENKLNPTAYLERFLGGERGVMVIVVGNGHGDASSNPGRD